MPLSLFDYKTLSHYREVVGVPDRFGHTFGGNPASFGIRFVDAEPLHLVYRLNLADPAVAVDLPSVTWLPLLYHFSFAAYDGELIYRVLNDAEIELISPSEATFDPDFPYPNYPPEFPLTPVSFVKEPYDPTVAEDAIKLAAIFGMGRVSASESNHATEVLEEKTPSFQQWEDDLDAEVSRAAQIRDAHKEPFLQGAPSKSCDNPECTAEVAYRTEPMTISSFEDFPDLVVHLEARDVRVPTMRVIALHQPTREETLMWDTLYAQLIFEMCDVCRCIRVTNQCD